VKKIIALVCAALMFLATATWSQSAVVRVAGDGGIEALGHGG